MPGTIPDSLEFLSFPETLSRGRILTLLFSAIFLIPKTVPAMQSVLGVYLNK